MKKIFKNGLLIFGILVGFAALLTQEIRDSQSMVAEAATVETRRVWVKVRTGGDNWWNNDNADTYIYNWKTSDGTYIAAWPGTKLIDHANTSERYDTPNGYYYFDVPVVYDKFKFARVVDGSYKGNQTSENNLGAEQNFWFAEIVTGTEGSISLSWVNDTTPETTAIVTAFAATIDTSAEACSVEAAQAAVDSYNSMSSFEQDQFDALDVGGGFTGLQRLNYLKTKYSIVTPLNWIDQNITQQKNADPYLLIALGLITLSSFAFAITKKARA